jgi:hypothetical protein
MGTTDVHAWLLPFDYEAATATNYGLSLLAPVVDSIRRANPGRTLLLDSGDLLQGSSLAASYTPLQPGEEHPVITAMNLMEYDAAALGNHEFNFGIDHLNRSIADADFPFLSANIVRAGTGEPAYREWVMVTRMVEGRPVRIGVTGVLPPAWRSGTGTTWKDASSSPTWWTPWRGWCPRCARPALTWWSWRPTPASTAPATTPTPPVWVPRTGWPTRRGWCRVSTSSSWAIPTGPWPTPSSTA